MQQRFGVAVGREHVGDHQGQRVLCVWLRRGEHLFGMDVDLQTKIDWPEFDPYSPSGLLVMARIDELIAQGRPVQLPLP